MAHEKSYKEKDAKRNTKHLVRFTEAEINSIMLTIKPHHSIHTYIDEAQDLQNLSAQNKLKIKTNLAGEKFELLVQYFEETLYSEEEFFLWSRRNFEHDIHLLRQL